MEVVRIQWNILGGDIQSRAHLKVDFKAGHIAIVRHKNPGRKSMNRALAAATAFAFFALTQGTGFGAAPEAPAFLRAAVADPHRPAADTMRDADREPLQMLAYSGIKPGDTVAELIPAGGYSTRLLSAAVGPKGHVYSINLATLNDNIKAQISPVVNDPAYANVSVLNEDFERLTVPESVDVVWTAQNYHDFQNPGMFHADTAAMDKAIFAALKPGGFFVVIDHAAAPGSGTRDSGSLHRIDPEVVKKEAMAAGFKLVGDYKVLGNPADDHTRRVTGQGGIADKSDKFYLKFQK
jgi:predicted methyltransferase